MDEKIIDNSELYALTHWDDVVEMMNDEFREQVHSELAPCTKISFLRRYLELDPELGILPRDYNVAKKDNIERAVGEILDDPWYELGENWQDRTPEEWIEFSYEQKRRKEKI